MQICVQSKGILGYADVRICRYMDAEICQWKFKLGESLFMHTPQKDNLILQLTFQFALDVILFTEELEAKRKYNLANQLFRSGTSIGANVREA